MDRVFWWIACILFVCTLITSSAEPTRRTKEAIRDEDQSITFPKCATSNCSECPGLDQTCLSCCKSGLVCYNYICQDCYDRNRQWKCSSHLENQEMLMTATQVTMTAALILGIITIFTLLWKVCTTKTQRRPPRRRRIRRRGSSHSGRSVDTVQQMVSERLRDAPPPYTRTILPPPGNTPPPYVALASQGHVNACFDPDYNAEPPSYDVISQPRSNTDNGNKTDATVSCEGDSKPGENTTADTTIHM